MGNVQDVDVGPIRNQSHAEEVAAEYIRNHPECEWTGQWNTTQPGVMSTIQIRRSGLDVDDLVGSSQASSSHGPLSSRQNPGNTFHTFLPVLDSAMQSLQHGLTSFLDERLNSVLLAGVGQSSSSGQGSSARLALSSNLSSDWEVLNTTDNDDSDDDTDDDNGLVHSFPTAPICHSRENLEDADMSRTTQSTTTVDAPTCSEVTELVAMFPETAESIICDLLENNNYDVDKTIEDLLKFVPDAAKTTDRDTKPKAASSASSLPTPSCPVCYEALKPPKRIFQCTNGHLVCEVCQRQPQLRGCPTCRQPIMGRATAMEQFLADLQNGAQSKN